MSLTIDLHSHSTASDGTLSPRELVRHARHSGLACLALTDHDTTAGLAEAAAEARAVGLDLIPGVEVSVTWNLPTFVKKGMPQDFKATVEISAKADTGEGAGGAASPANAPAAQ